MLIAIDSYPSEKITSEFTGDVLLSNISWQTYQAMLADIGDRSSLRLIYDRGELEIKRQLDLW